MRSLFAFLFVFLFLIIGFPIQGIMWIIGKFNPYWADMAQLKMVQWAFRCVYKISGVKLTINGLENIPKDEAVLYIANHRGFFDVIITYTLCPGLTGYIAKDNIKKVPLLRLWMKRLHCLFLAREDIKEGLKVILSAIDLVKSGVSIFVFPEGTRNKDKENPKAMLPFKEGSFKIATKTGCKIVPIAITGTDEVLENHFPWIKSRPVTITYGEPIDPKSLSKEDQKRIGAYTQSVIENLL